MKATFLDLRRNPTKIFEALEHNEVVTLSRHGREIAKIVPLKTDRRAISIRESPAFGIWKNRTDMKDPPAFVRKLRKGRFNDL